MIRGAKSIINAQVEINRAVWAMNLTDERIADLAGSFNTLQGRKDYIKQCAESAIKDLHEYLKISDLLIF